MRTFKRLTGVVFALCMAVAGASTASASVLVSNQGSTFFSMSDFGGFFDLQPIAEVAVTGSTNVNISGFGVYGRPEAAGKIGWVIFDGTDVVYRSGAQSVSLSGEALTTSLSDPGWRWYDSPAISLTLLQGHTYSMGVVTSDVFAWGRNALPAESNPGSAITGNGLTITPFESIVQSTLAADGFYAGNPLLWPGDGSGWFQGSVRVEGIPTAPIPEPSEWAMLLAGLMVVGFVAKRQRRRNI